MGLSTIIGKVNKDSAGHNLDASMKRDSISLGYE
jgi:hypothetical protein